MGGCFSHLSIYFKGFIKVLNESNSVFFVFCVFYENTKYIFYQHINESYSVK